MAHPTVKLEGDTFIFSNAQVTIAVETNFPQEPLTVESATLTTPHDNTVDLGITNFEVPPPVVEHVLDQVTPSVASVPNATLSQEGEMVDIAVTDPESFVHIIEGGAAFGLPAVQGSVEGLLGGPDTLIAIELALNPPAIGNPNERFIEQTVAREHLELNIKIDLESKVPAPEALSYSWPDEAVSTLTGLTDHPDWVIV